MKVKDKIKKIARYVYKQSKLIRLLNDEEILNEKYKKELDLANQKIEDLEIYVNSDFINQKLDDAEFLLQKYRKQKHEYQKEIKDYRLKILKLENDLQDVNKNKII